VGIPRATFFNIGKIEEGSIVGGMAGCLGDVPRRVGDENQSNRESSGLFYRGSLGKKVRAYKTEIKKKQGRWGNREERTLEEKNTK